MEVYRLWTCLRNSHDKTIRVAMTDGYRVFVCSNMAFSGDFTPVLAKHAKSFSLIDCVSVGVDRMQRNFKPMRKEVEAWQQSELPSNDSTDKKNSAWLAFPSHNSRQQRS